MLSGRYSERADGHYPCYRCHSGYGYDFASAAQEVYATTPPSQGLDSPLFEPR
jgi:hypothetical protein